MILVFLAFLAGLLTALSPCVYPLIPITLGLIKKEKPESFFHGFSLSLVYVLGMAIIYSLLGITFAYFGLISGSMMQNPYVIFFLGLFFFVMSLSMLDVFLIALPEKFLNTILKYTPKGYVGAFLMGAFSGFLATPCTGPMLAFILGLIAKGQNIKQGILLMISYSLGLGLLFLVLGSSTYFLKMLPKSGPWMKVIKYILAFGMMAISFYYMSILFFSDKNKDETRWHVISSKNTVDDFDLLLTNARENNQKVLIDFYADWCVLCKKLEKTTFSDKRLREALKDFMLIKVDLTKNSSEIEKITKRFNITGLPVLIILPQDKRIYGYISPIDLLKSWQLLE